MRPREHQLTRPTAQELLAPGKERGQLDAARRLIGAALRQRLGRLPRRLERALAECPDRARIERLLLAALQETEPAKLKEIALELLTNARAERPKRRARRST